MLVVDPANRLSAVDILEHPWVTVSIRHNTSLFREYTSLFREYTSQYVTI